MPVDDPHPLLVHEDTWEGFAEAAGRLAEPDRLRHLCTLLLCLNPITVTSSNTRYGLPDGRPSVDLGRSVAAGLLEQPLEPPQRVLALLMRWHGTFVVDEHRANRLTSLREAEAAARSLDDPLLLAVVLLLLSKYHTQTHSAARAVPLSEESVDLASEAEPALGLFALTVTAWRETRDAAVARLHVEIACRRRLAVARRYSGDFEGWVATLAETEVIARELLPVHPRVYGGVLSSIADMEHLVLGQANLSRFEELVPTDDVPANRRGLRAQYLIQHAANLLRRGDLQGAIEVNRHRIRFWLLNRDVPVDASIPELTEAVRQMAMAQRRQLNDVANPAWEIARLLQQTGDRTDRDARRREAEAYLDLAEAIWAGWGTNGLVAVDFRRATLRPEDDQDAVLQMLDVTRRASKPGLRTNAILHAAQRANGSTAPAVLAMVDSMLNEAWQDRDRARALVARSWLTRAGGPLSAGTSSADADAALALMPGRPSGALELVALAGWAMALDGAARVDASMERRGLDVAIDAAARLYSSATTRGYRAYLADTWSGVARYALAFADAHHDHELADVVAEVARRDGAAVLMNDAAEDELVPEEDRRAAQEVRRTTGADPGAVGGKAEDPGEEEEPDEDADRALRAAGFAASDRDRQYWLEAADQRLVALGAELDPSTLYRSRPRLLLGASSRPTFVLQLLPSTHRAVQSEHPVLYRRLTWGDAEHAREHFDSVPLDVDLLQDAEPGVLRLPRSADVFPEPLVAAFRKARRDNPIRLLVVPTGLFHLPWDALEIEGRALIDRAIVSVHTSLTAALRIRDVKAPAIKGGSVGIFDPTLKHTSRERQALRRHFPALREPQGRASLKAEITASGALLALGLHGLDDKEPWAQAKVLPNQERLTAAEALHLRFPAVCVLASCFSSVRTSGTDTAGFPTALFMRGAQTIIGSIGGIPDRATSEILALFYEQLEAGGNPVEALRDARLAWLDADRTRQRQREQWARLVAYGGAQF